MDHGRWDSAFAYNSNKPVALYLAGTPFARTPYLGNQMLNSHPGETMLDAYDALLFLGPIESLHFSATIDFIYTESFKAEVARRVKVLYDGNIESLLKENRVNTLDEYIQLVVRRGERRTNNLIKD
jgi:hypothetical protein